MTSFLNRDHNQEEIEVYYHTINATKVSVFLIVNQFIIIMIVAKFPN